ncbi:unnamed protein product, partial [Oppiella nova]
WDIENCQVPFNRSVIQLVERVRQLAFERQYCENVFEVVCDTRKIAAPLLDDLNTTQVTVIHVCGFTKNASDLILMQRIDKFIADKGYNSAIVMISDDINFSPILSKHRNNNRVEVTLIQRRAA